MSSSTAHHELLGPPQINVKRKNPETSHVPKKGYTENGSSTYNSSGNPLLDFFFHVVPDTPAKSVTERLELAWNYNPLKALKLICNLRGIRGTGKSDKEGFYAAALWLHKHHPKTLACNLKAIADFGYFKDLPEILYRLLEGIDIHEIQKRERGRNKNSKSSRGGRFTSPPPPKRRRTTSSSSKSRKERISDELKRVEVRKETASVARKEKRAAKAKKGMERYKRDPDYRFLYDKVSELFAECLVSDLELLKSGKPTKISLAAKWCPSLDYSFDQSTLLCEGIARRVFPRNSSPEYENIKEAYYTYRIRDRLRKEYLVPLRKALQSPEIYMSSNNWKELPYGRVPSVAMKNYKDVFGKHDKERFEDYLESVKRGDKKIAAGALLPHQIIKSLEKDDNDCSVAELQWKRMVDDLLKIGKLKDCLAICDVSGSMEGTPMEVCVALGLLVSELSEKPCKGNLITFSFDPKWHKIKGHSLHSKIKSIKRMDWKMSTDFQKVFELILKVAVKGKLEKEQMIKRLFVFSDMEFDQASENDWDWETDYEAIQRRFKREGYSVPEIVFWNLRDSKATPVMSNQKGVALVSGFSKNLVKLFLDGADDMTPMAVMEKAISGQAYDQLVVID